MKKRKLASILSAVVLLLTLFVGCKKEKKSEKPVVGLVMKSLANEFFKSMEEGARKYANEDGSFELLTVGMNSETDIDTQVSAMDNFITKGVDMIVVAPADSVGMVPSVKRAIDAGILVVNIDVVLNKDALRNAGLEDDFLFVGPDNADGAELVGNHLGEKLSSGGKVFIIEGNPGADNAKQRKAGFMRAVNKYNLDLLSSTSAHWETEEANSVVSNLLIKYPDVQGIMCANDSMVIGAVKALDAAGRTDVLVVGFDNISAVQQLIKEGKVLATVDQFGPEMAANGIKTGFTILGGDKLTGWQKTPVKLITKEDL